MLLEEGGNLFGTTQIESGLFYSLLTVFLPTAWQDVGSVE